MNKLSTKRRAAIIAALVEGNSIRATGRMTGSTKDTVIKLLREIGRACAEYQDRAFQNLTCKRLQCDEIWNFCYSKQKNIPTGKEGVWGFGDVYTWTAIDADTKLVPCWLLGRRDTHAAVEFISDLASRLKYRVQLTTDGHRPYLEAVEGAFGCEIDYAMLIKVYGHSQDETRYSPAECVDCVKKEISGNPDPKHINTSYVERQNLTMRMGMRRFTRLTNAFSKKVENLGYAVALHFMHYNFVRIHQSLRCTPAMAAGVSKTLWSIEDIVGLLDQ